MVICKQFTKEVLEKRQISWLCGLYMTAFSASIRVEEDRPQVDLLVEIFYKRSYTERAEVFRSLERQLRGAISSQNYTQASLLRDMRDYYHKKAM